MSGKIAKRFVVRGRVQGVGFRSFVEHCVRPLELTGWVRNLDNGSVEVYAVGAEEHLTNLENRLWRGPRTSEVRGINVYEEEVDAGLHGFSIRY